MQANQAKEEKVILFSDKKKLEHDSKPNPKEIEKTELNGPSKTFDRKFSEQEELATAKKSIYFD